MIDFSFFTRVSPHVALRRSLVLGRGVLNLVEELRINCEDAKNGCNDLCGRDYHESYAWS